MEPGKWSWWRPLAIVWDAKTEKLRGRHCGIRKYIFQQLDLFLSLYPVGCVDG
jgi:hypothetical protein